MLAPAQLFDNAPTTAGYLPKQASYNEEDIDAEGADESEGDDKPGFYGSCKAQQGCGDQFCQRYQPGKRYGDVLWKYLAKHLVLATFKVKQLCHGGIGP